MTMSDGDSDGGETTLGSPRSPPESLSPCLWAGDMAPSVPTARPPLEEVLDADNQRMARLSDVCASMETQGSLSPPLAVGTTSNPPARKTLMLSPASQLDVLSQISEMAERNHRPAPVQVAPMTVRPHVWATAQRRRKKRSAAPSTAAGEEGVEANNASLVTLPTGNSKKRRAIPAPQPQLHHSDKLEADMLDWETCSEDVFLGHDDTSDAWEFEDVGDSDFE